MFPLLFVVDTIINALILMIVVSSILSWFSPDPRNPVVRLVNAIVEPVLHPIRAIVPPIGGFSLDILIAVLLLGVIQRVFLRALTS